MSLFLRMQLLSAYLLFKCCLIPIYTISSLCSLLKQSYSRTYQVTSVKSVRVQGLGLRGDTGSEPCTFARSLKYFVARSCKSYAGSCKSTFFFKPLLFLSMSLLGLRRYTPVLTFDLFFFQFIWVILKDCMFFLKPHLPVSVYLFATPANSHKLLVASPPTSLLLQCNKYNSYIYTRFYRLD